MELEKVFEIIKQSVPQTFHFNVIHEDGKRTKVRLNIVNDTPFIYSKNKRRWGNYLGQWTTREWKALTPIMPTPPIKKTRNTLATAIKYLDASGLWQGLNLTFKALLAMTDEELEGLRESSYDNYCKSMSNIAETCGGEFCSMDMFCSMGNRNIHTINYPQWQKEWYCNCFENAIKEKREHYSKWQKGYDNSVSCNVGEDGQMRAWYSEEYRGCANGHYYIALDSKHALYCEDD